MDIYPKFIAQKKQRTTLNTFSIFDLGHLAYVLVCGSIMLIFLPYATCGKRDFMFVGMCTGPRTGCVCVQSTIYLFRASGGQE